TDTWDVRMEFSRNAKVTLAPGGDPGELPHGGCAPEMAQEVIGFLGNTGTAPVLPHAPGEGHLLFAWVVIISSVGERNPDGFTGLGAGWVDDPSGTKNIRCRMFYRIVEAGDSATINTTTVAGGGDAWMHVSECACVDKFDFYDENLDDTAQSADPMVFVAGPLTPLAGRSALMFGGIMPSLNTNDVWMPAGTDGAHDLGISGIAATPFSGNSDPKSWIGYKAGPSAIAVPQSFTVVCTPTSGVSRAHAGLMAVFSGSCDGGDSIPPGVSTPIRNEFVAEGDDSTTEFTTLFPYAPGSLRVFVDGVPIINGLTETDPTTGTFTLDFAPPGAIGDTRAEIVTADYQVGTPCRRSAPTRTSRSSIVPLRRSSRCDVRPPPTSRSPPT